MSGLHVIQYPSGTFGFVGRVPAALAFTSTHEDDLKTAALCGPGLARKIAEREGRMFGNRTWPTRDAAIETAVTLGYMVGV